MARVQTHGRDFPPYKYPQTNYLFRTGCCDFLLLKWISYRIVQCNRRVVFGPRRPLVPAEPSKQLLSEQAEKMPVLQPDMENKQTQTHIPQPSVTSLWAKAAKVSSDIGHTKTNTANL